MFEDNIDNKIDPDRSDLFSDEDDRDPSCKPPSQKVETQFAVNSSLLLLEIQKNDLQPDTADQEILAKQNLFLSSVWLVLIFEKEKA